MRRTYLVIITCLMTVVSYGQLEVDWRTLADVTFEDKYLQELDAYYWHPTFGEQVKQLEGEEIIVTGYVIPVDYESNYYILSAFPYASCFFCGNAGPETVIELEIADDSQTFTTDQRLRFVGTLKLNATDIYKMNYILQEAEVYP